MYYNHKDGVKLRKMERSDLPELLKLKQESWWGTHQTLIVNIEDQNRWFQGIPSNELYMIAEKNFANPGDDSWMAWSVVGVACYRDIDSVSRTLNISGSILENKRNMNVTKPAFAAGLDFAFEILNMQRVGAEVLESNAAAQMLEINFLGFAIEGRRRRAVYKSGRYYDSVMLGLLREEWEGCDRVQSYGGCCNTNFDSALAEKAIQRLNRKMDSVAIS